LVQIFGAFDTPPPCGFLVAQHMPAGFTAAFAERLDALTSLSAQEARGGERVTPGSILIAPGGCHLELATIGGGVVTRVIPSTPSDKYVPSVDRLFTSAAKHVGADLLAVILTGMGDDGRAGVEHVSEAGGRVIAESEKTAVIFGMPRQAISTGAVDAVLPLPEMAAAIQGVATKGSNESSTMGKSI
jgi:two-component system chemotaxis response regulator CheB